ncbi:hypothetical protein F0562_032152 [Nyssa sinensis]|uniref:Uncharacterized protein n=1 Tax=Nyssa sinensis TaxID=561372 RepID=A0A5J5AVX4_9ASTE|nr:hypothetical protein F0562_032152 [Nyssa sinensis]
MADFPPNLEDGEKWLPSDIFEEIISGHSTSEALVRNTAKEGVLDESWKTTVEISTNSYVGFNGVAVDHHPLAFQPSCVSLSSYSPIPPTQSQIESLEHGGTSRVSKEQLHVNGFCGCRGTGVFLPRVTTHLQKQHKSIRGTGVFHQPFAIDAPPTPIFKEKKCGMNGEGTKKMHVSKKGRIVE